MSRGEELKIKKAARKINNGILNKDLLKMDAVEIYKLVLGRKIGKFPNGFWNKPEAMENAAKCTRYLIEEYLGMNEEDIKTKVKIHIFRGNKLGGMAKLCFGNSTFAIINNAYPGKYRISDIWRSPNEFWTEELLAKELLYVIEEKLNLTEEELLEKYCTKFLMEHNVYYGATKLFSKDGNIKFKAIDLAYPGKFKPWEFNCVPKRYWESIENRREAIRYVFLEKLKFKEDELVEKASKKLFTEHGLMGMLYHYYGGSPVKAINSLYKE